jgi:hypothetical protein
MGGQIARHKVRIIEGVSDTVTYESVLYWAQGVDWSAA